MSFVAAKPSVLGDGVWHTSPFYSRSSFWNRPLQPKQLNADQSQSAHVANQIQYGRQGHTFVGYSGVGYGRFQWPGSIGFNFDQFTYPIYVVDNTTPTQKVGLWNPGSPNEPIGQGFTGLQQYFNAVPIPDKTLCPRITGTAPYVDIWSPSENGVVIIDKDTGECWELYGTSNTGPADMQTAMSCTWLARSGGYMPSMSEFCGVFPNHWGDRASCFGALGGLITMQDLRDVFNGGRINHALAFACGFNGGPGTSVPPATRGDGAGPNGNNVAAIPSGYPNAGQPNPAYGHDVTHEGTGLTFPDTVSLTGCTHPLSLAIAEAIRDYGLYISDTTGACGVYIEDTRTIGSPYHAQGVSAVDPRTFAWPGGSMLKLGSGYSVLNQLPWDQLQVLAPVAG